MNAAVACVLAALLIIATIIGIYAVTNWRRLTYEARHSRLPAPDLPARQEPVPGIADPGCSPADLTMFDLPPVMARRYVTAPIPFEDTMLLRPVRVLAAIAAPEPQAEVTP